MQRATGMWVTLGVAICFFLLLASLRRGDQRQPSKDLRPRSEHELEIKIQQESPAHGTKAQPQVEAGSVRVCLTLEPVKDITLQVNGPFQMSSVDSRQVLHHGPKLYRTTVSVADTGFKIAGRQFPQSRVQFSSHNDGGIWVGDREYGGTIQLQRVAAGRLRVVNLIGLEEYVATVVDSEMPREFGNEARKAQAIVARTYAVSHRLSAKKSPFDLYASTRSQKYNGRKYTHSDGRLLAGVSKDAQRIAAETRGLILNYRGRPFCTYYSAVCGGQTSVGSAFFSDAAPILKSVKCEYCVEAPLYRWTAMIGRRDIQNRLVGYFTQLGNGFGTLKNLEMQSPATVGGIGNIRVTDESGSREVTATVFRRTIGAGSLHSHRFELAQNGSNWIFRGRGHGHGVGLCQWGARGMGRVGRNCGQILSTYYPGAKIVVLSQ